jgi:Phosphotransferase enzyme family
VARREITRITDDLERHPAVLAWRQVELRAGRPTLIEVLKPERNGSAAFRITGIGRAGRPVVAKRRPLRWANLELRLYTELLPTLSIPRLPLFGFVLDGGYGWLFLEDAGDVRYAPELPEHGALAAEWLAGVHTGAAFADWLPRTGLGYFHTQLDLARAGVRAGFAHTSVTSSDVEVLRRILTKLDRVEELWPELEAALTGVPETLVHGDFVPKNVRVRATTSGPQLIAFDWETAGWASPAADLALLPGNGSASAAYHERIADSWPGLQRADVDRLRRVGMVLRLIHAVKWEARSFKYPWIERTMRHMVAYDHHLDEALRDDVWLRA